MADLLLDVFGDSSTIMLALMVFLATAVPTFGVMLAVRARGAVKRRTAGIAELPARPSISARCAPPA
jgi:hypothetical protein